LASLPVLEVVRLSTSCRPDARLGKAVHDYLEHAAHGQARPAHHGLGRVTGADAATTSSIWLRSIGLLTFADDGGFQV